MITYSIFTKNYDDSEIIKANLVSVLDKNDFVFKEKQPDIVFVIGGDGTVLRAYREFFDSIDKTKFVVIHDGTLGYFADFEKDKLEYMVDLIKNNKVKLIKRSLVEMKLKSKMGKISKLTALNEVRIESLKQALICDVFLNDDHLETFRGNGFCISSPSGSTAYNKSLKGAIVQNSLEVFQITEIASINHNKYHCLNASLVLSKESKITLKPIPHSEFSIGYDTDFFSNKSVWLKNENDDIDELICGLSKKSAMFLVPEGTHFAKRLKRCFII